LATFLQPDSGSTSIREKEPIGTFLENYGKSLGLETLRDEIGNVLVRKPATPGMENRKAVVLQAHMDMVPQKTAMWHIISKLIPFRPISMATG